MRVAAALVALLFILVPGAGLALALFPPGRASLITRVALCFPLGYGAIALAALTISVARVMTRPVFLAAYAAGAIAVWVFALRRGRLSANLRAWREEIAAEPWTHAMGLVLVLGFAAVRLTYYPELNFKSPTSFRYWADGLEIADAHRVPALVLQWGHLYPPTVSKVALNAFEAGASFLLGRGPLVPLGALLFALSIGLVLVTFGLARQLGLKLTAALAPLLLFANQVIGLRALTNDLQVYRAEDVGRLAALAAVLLAVRASRAKTFREGRRDGVLAGVMLGVTAGTHLVPFAVAVAFAGSYALARVALDRRPAPVLAVGGAALAATLLVGAVVLVVPGGTLGFQSTSRPGADAKLASDLGLPNGFDPTEYLASGLLDQPPHANAGPFYTAPSRMYTVFVRRIIGQQVAGRRYLVLVPLGALAALALAFWLGTRDLRATSAAAVSLAIILFATALYFTYRYHVYALAQFGPRRLFDYTAFPPVLLALTALEVLLGLLGKVHLVGGTRPWAAPVAVILTFVVLTSVFLPRDVAPRGRALLASSLGPLSWIERNVPCAGRVLADRRTLATFETFTRHAGVLEGAGPYFRPDVLEPALRQLLDAKAFFEDPSAGEDYLRNNGVASVVVARAPQAIGGVYRVGALDEKALSSAGFLQLTARSRLLSVFRVVGFDPSWSAGLPSAIGRPGFECGSS